MEGISINELNPTNPNNVQESYFIPDNEANIPFLNTKSKEKEEYEGKKSKIKKTRLTVLFLTLSTAGLLGGKLLANPYLQNKVDVTNISFQRSNMDTLKYSFEINNLNQLFVTLEIKNEESLIFKKEYREIGLFEGEVKNLSEYQNLHVSLYENNGVDYQKLIYQEFIEGVNNGRN